MSCRATKIKVKCDWLPAAHGKGPIPLGLALMENVRGNEMFWRSRKFSNDLQTECTQLVLYCYCNLSNAVWCFLGFFDASLSLFCHRLLSDSQVAFVPCGIVLARVTAGVTSVSFRLGFALNPHSRASRCGDAKHWSDIWRQGLRHLDIQIPLKAWCKPGPHFCAFLVILKAFVTCVGVTLTQIYSDKADVMKEWRREPACLPFRPILTNAKFTRNGFKRWSKEANRQIFLDVITDRNADVILWLVFREVPLKKKRVRDGGRLNLKVIRHIHISDRTRAGLLRRCISVTF